MTRVFITHVTHEWVEQLKNDINDSSIIVEYLEPANIVRTALDHSSDETLIILGPKSQDITSILNQIHHQHKTQMVYVIQAQDQLTKVKQSLMFLPFSGKSTKVFSSEENVGELIRTFVESKTKKNQYSSLLEASKSRMQSMEVFQVRAQQVLGHIMQQLPIGVFIINKQNILESANNFGCSMMGKEESELLGKSFVDLFDQTEKNKIERALSQQLETEIELTKNGETSYFSLSLSEIGETENVVVLNNVTEQRKSVIAMEQLTYIASHDLQEPLRSIQGMTNMLISDYSPKLDDNGARMMDYVNDAAVRMGELIRSVLQFSQIGHEKNLEKIDMNELVDQVLLDLKFKIEEAGAQLIIDKLPTLEGNPMELGVLMQNLVGNALKFRRSATPLNINVSAKKVNQDWEFCVQDNGIGIPKDQLENVFVIFRRLNNQKDYKGTGIGLTHCKKIVESHQGTIWAESEFGQGTTFYFTIPA